MHFPLLLRTHFPGSEKKRKNIQKNRAASRRTRRKRKKRWRRRNGKRQSHSSSRWKENSKHRGVEILPTIETLEIEIKKGANTAASELDTLARMLSALKAPATQSANSLNKTANAVSALNRSLKSLNTGDFEAKLKRISSGLKALNDSTQGLKISSVGKQLASINDAAEKVKWTDGDKLEALANGLKPLGELGRAHLTSFANQLEKLPAVIEKLENADIEKFTQQMKDLSAAMKPFADEMQKVSNGFAAFPSRIQRLVTSTEQYNSTVRKAASGTSLWSKALRGISFAAVFRGATKLLANALKTSSEYTETMSMFSVSMGKYSEEAYNYAQKVSEVMGIDPATWMQNQGVFQSIVTGFGVAEDKAAVMSKNLTQLGYDLSSFYNITVEDAMQKVQSGISGELEPLRRLGYDLSVARLQQEALNLGIEKSVSEMTQAEKAQLRYHAMLTQVTHAQGDMARTLDQPANQLRILQAQLTQASRALGDLFIPVLNKVLPVAIAVVSILRELINEIGTLLGIQMADSVEWSGSEDATSGIAENLEGAASAAKEMKRFLSGIDELNIMPDQSNGSAESAENSFDLEPIDYSEKFLEGAVTQRLDEVKEKIAPIVKIALAAGAAFATWKISAPVVRSIETVRESLNGIGKSVGDGKLLLAVAVVATLSARFLELYKNSESFRTGLERIGKIGAAVFEGIGEAAGRVEENFSGFVERFSPIIEPIKEFFSGLEIDLMDLALIVAGFVTFLLPGGKLVGAALLGFEAITLAVRALGSMTDEEFDAMLEHAGNVFSGIWELGESMLTGLLLFITGAFTGDWETAFAGLETVASGALNFVGTLTEEIFGVNVANVVSDWYTDNVKPWFTYEKWANLFNDVKLAIKQKTKDAINGAIELFNRFIGWVNEKMSFSWGSLTIAGKTLVEAGSIQLFTIPKLPKLYAEGGFPDVGELFIANEAGPEYVGRIGNRPAVANRDQIVDGIASANEGVIAAIFSAAIRVISAINEKDSNVYIDGNRLAARVTNSQASQSRMYGR